MIHNVYDMFVIFCTVKILHILYIYGLCHIFFSILFTYGSMECMHESIFVIDDCTYTINKIVLTVPYKCMYFTLHYMSLNIVRDKPSHTDKMNNTDTADILLRDCICVLKWLFFWIQHTSHVQILLIIPHTVTPSSHRLFGISWSLKVTLSSVHKSHIE